MTQLLSREFALKVGKSACCAAIGLACGHLGVLTFGLFAAFAGVTETEAAKKAFEEGGKKLGEMALEAGWGHFENTNPALEELYCTALHDVFHEVSDDLRDGERAELDAWLKPWMKALKDGVPAGLDTIQVQTNDVAGLDAMLSDTLIRLRAQGEMKAGSVLLPRVDGPVPSALILLLKREIPARLPVLFDALLGKAGHVVARMQYDRAQTEQVLASVAAFRSTFESTFGLELNGLRAQVTSEAVATRRTIDERADLHDAKLATLERMIAQLLAKKQGTAAGVPVLSADAAQRVVAETAERVPVVAEAIEQRTASPEASTVPQGDRERVAVLLREGRVEEAGQLLTKLVAEGQSDQERARVEHVRREEEERQRFEGEQRRQNRALAADLFELAGVNELRFEWNAALENYRRAWELSEKQRADYGFKLAHFADSLNHHAEAIEAYEAVLPLCSDDFDQAGTLNNLGLLYGATQRHGDAEGVYVESLALRRRLAEANPAAYEPDVAATLNNLGNLYVDTQRHGDAEGVYVESLALYRRLAEANPAAYEPDVAMTLNNLGILYRNTQRHGDAEGAYLESLALRRRLAEANPAAYEPDVAMTLNNLGLLYGATQRHGDAEGVYLESLALYRRLAEANPAAHEPKVALTLNNLGALYVATQRHGDAEGMYLESLALHRRLAEANPAAYEPDVAMTLNNLGNLYVDTQRHGDAEGVYVESLALYRRLAEANPAAYEPDVAMTLNNLGILYRNTQRHGDAEGVYVESLALHRRLAEANPAAYEPDVAMTLNNLGALYGDTQRHGDAERVYLESLAIRRRLAEANPAAYEPKVAGTLNNLGVLYIATQRYDDAERVSTDAEAILAPWWKGHPAAHGDLMARILWVLAMCREGSGSATEAKALGQRALEVAGESYVRLDIQRWLDALDDASPATQG